MADIPDYLVLKRHRELAGREWHVWLRRSLLLVCLGLPAALGLANVFGQRPDTTIAAVPVASLKVYAPSHLRGGLLFMGRFTIDAHQDVKKAILVLDSGWAESMSINTIEPSPVGEASRNGDFSFELGHIPKGKSYILYMEFQVNPTNVGRRSQDVELFDGNTHLLTIHRTVTIWP
ncbi:MAG: hypothetical protein QOE36_2058 [Gaiellaceae bacterium]|nr:hypothetical protein [Gaiellaceae bacterium]